MHLLSDSESDTCKGREGPEYFHFFLKSTILTDYCSHYFNPGSRALDNTSLLNLFTMVLKDKKTHAHLEITRVVCDTQKHKQKAQCIIVLHFTWNLG